MGQSPIEQVFRDEWGRVLASLIGYFGDFDLAEDAAAEAFAVAAQRWPADGTPDNPGAWLVTTARHRAIDRLRRDRVLAAKLRLLAAEQPGEDSVETTAVPDERLELIFMGCHPALAIEAQVALTLRAVGGLSTEEIARSFLVPAETMKRRLTRAKSKIKVAGIPFGVPAGPRLPERLGAVLAGPPTSGRLTSPGPPPNAVTCSGASQKPDLSLPFGAPDGQSPAPAWSDPRKARHAGPPRRGPAM
jgi:RNA polymerase sigma-70 factor, ECF subfamily